METEGALVLAIVIKYAVADRRMNIYNGEEGGEEGGETGSSRNVGGGI